MSRGHLRLEVISGIALGDTILVEDELVIGRHATGDGRLAEDEEISRQHARISREATGDYAIEDLGSSNGTFVNGLRIASPRLLELGDSIETGATTLVVRELVKPQSQTVVGRAPVTEQAATGESDSSTIAPTPTPERPGEAPLADETPLTSQTPPLTLKLEVDFDEREARIALGEDGSTVRLRLEDGAWRLA